MSSRIQDKINAPKQKTVWEKLVEPLQTQVFAYSTITLVMLICAGVYFNQKEQTLPVKQLALITISADDLYNSDEMNEMDETTLADAVPTTIATQSSTEAEDYLMDANTDEADIMNAL